MALKRPAVSPAEGLLTEAVLKHGALCEPPPVTHKRHSAHIGARRRVAVISPAFRPCATRRNRWPRTCARNGLQAGDARKKSPAVQPPGFGEFDGGAFGFASEGISGGEAAA